jgi:uncharacterized protein (TIGR03437 family)
MSMQRKSIMRNRYFTLATLATLFTAAASAATFGRVVPIGGHASDIALDERRGVLYIANYAGASIDVMSLSEASVNRSISVAPYPGSLALSPDGRYLVIGHYASSGGAALLQPGRDALTVIDLTNSQKRSYGLSSGPVGVAFGLDGLALIVTQNDFLLFDPASGAVTRLGSVANVASQVLPVAMPAAPPQIIGGSITATADGRHILGVAGVTPDTGEGSILIRFSYNVPNKAITAADLFTSAPSLAPRAISVSRDGSYYMAGWGLFGCGQGFLHDCTADAPLLAQWPNAVGKLNVGSVAIRSSKSLIYAQMSPLATASTSSSQTVCLPNGTCVTVTTPSTTPAAAPSTVPPSLMVMDADNLTVRDRIQIPENLAGRSIFNSDESVLYAISDSGVMVLSMNQFDRAPRVVPSVEDVVFRGNFCNTTASVRELDVVDPSGNAVPFQVCLAGAQGCAVPPGVTITPSAAVTPARIKISIDTKLIGSILGTKTYQFEILSAAAVNMPAPPSRGTAENYTANVRGRFRVLLNNREPQNRGVFVNAPGELVDLLADPARNRFYIIRQDKNQVLVYNSSTNDLVTTLRTGNTPTSLAITFDRKQLLIGADNSGIAHRYDLDSLTPLPPIIFPLGHYPRSIAVSARAILAASRVAGPVQMIDSIDLVAEKATPLPSLGPWKNDVHVSTTLAAAPNGSTIMAAMPDGRLALYNANANTFTVTRQDVAALKGAIAASSYGTYLVDHFLLNESLVTMSTVGSQADTSSGFAFHEQEGLFATISSSGAGWIQRMKSSAQLPLPTQTVESPLVGDTEYPFRRTVAPLADRSAIVELTTSGFTVLPWNYEAGVAPPVIDRVVNAADFTKPVAPGGLASVFGSQLSPTTLASTDVPLPTVLADSCLTVNGAVVPVIFVSPSQINFQFPFGISGNAEVVLRTPGGASDSLRTTILPAAPSVFRSGAAGPVSEIPTIVRSSNGGLVTVSNPIHPDDRITVYLTGLGRTSPEVETGAPSPFSPLAAAIAPVTMSLGGVELFVDFAGLTPGSVGVYQINAKVPFKGIPTGFEIPLVISQGGASTVLPVRVVN